MALIDAGMEEWGDRTRFDLDPTLIQLETTKVAGSWSRYSIKWSFGTGQAGVNIGANRQEVFIGARLLLESLNHDAVFVLKDAGTTQVWLDITGGQLRLYRGSSTLLAQSTNLLANNRWYFIEMRAVIADAGGVAQVWVDEALWIDFTGDTKATANAYVNQAYWGVRFNVMDDLYVLDATGAVNNSRLGDVACAGLRVTGAGDAAQLTPVGAAANWDCVDELPPDNATTYVQSSTLDQQDLHALEDMPAELADVKGVVLAARAQKSDAGSANIALGVKYDSNGDGTADTESWGVDQPLSTSWAYHKRVFDTQPDGTGWTRAKVDALQGGYKVR